MNFFQHQDQARRNTRLLILFFSLAVVALITITTVFVAALLYFFEYHQQKSFAALQAADGGLQLMGNIVGWQLVGSIAALIITVVALASTYRLLQLRSGGESVAEALGGRRLQPNSGDLHERKLLNVVEEMAIASGTPVPPVFVLEDDAINAFAAGNSVNDAVIGVTRGGMQHLNREQLQGVIAHEFSHILNGDMTLNLRLLGVLNGILVIGLLGSLLLRGSTYRTAYAMGSRRNKNASGIALLGLGLVIIGYAGTFFGKLIKAAVSRQREFLADASAVQFTRNPQGIGEALQVIGGFGQGSRLQHPRAEEFSHMYFGEGVRTAFHALMATHPPLEERIRRIDPHWDGHFLAVDRQSSATADDQAISRFTTTASTSPAAGSAADIDPLEIVAAPSALHVHKAGEILDTIPAALAEAAREPFRARAVIYNLLLQPSEVGERQMQQLQQRAHPAVVKFVIQQQDAIKQLQTSHRLPLFELTIPALKTLSARQFNVFRENVVALIKADKKVEIFEWALYHMLLHALQSQQRKLSPGARSNIRHLAVPIQQLLSTLSRADRQQEDLAEASYNAAMAQLALANLPLLAEAQLSLPMLDSAMQQLQSLKPLQKPALLKAMQTCIKHDQQITSEEYELFRAVAHCLDCPMPPLL